MLFQKTIEEYLNNLAKSDSLFAEKFNVKDKPLKKCCDFIISEVKNKNKIAFTNDEIFQMAKHFYEEDIDIGKIKSNECKVVITKEQLTEEDLKQIEEQAKKQFEEEKKKVIANQIATRKQKLFDTDKEIESVKKETSKILNDLEKKAKSKQKEKKDKDLAKKEGYITLFDM